MTENQNLAIATEASDNSNVVEFHVPKEFKRAINKLASAQEKSAAVMQTRMFDIGEQLAIVKDEYFGGETQAFGTWLSDNCPKIHQNYVAFYLSMYKNKADVIKMLKRKAHKAKTSPQTIVRTFRSIRDGKLDKDGKKVPSVGNTGKGADKKAGKGKGADKDDAAGSVIKTEGMELTEALDSMVSIAQLLIAYGNAVEFTDKQKGICSDLSEILAELSD